MEGGAMVWLIDLLAYLAGCGVTITAGFATYLAFFQSPFYFPRPTGSSVGTQVHHIISAEKELMIQIWYPSTRLFSSLRPITPYSPYLIEYMKRNDTLNWLLSMSRPMYSYAIPAATFSSSHHNVPVILFSHGYGCTRNNNTAHCEELASHGYVVVGVSHSIGCEVIKFPSRLLCDYLNIILPAQLLAYTSQYDTQKFFEDPMSDFVESDHNMSIWMSDMSTVLEYLEGINANQNSEFYHKLDMNNVGIFGHSFGGATAIQMCRNDSRIKAGVNMDGTLYGLDFNKPFNKPCMFLLAGEFESEAEEIDSMEKAGFDYAIAEAYVKESSRRYLDAMHSLCANIGQNAYMITIQDATHSDFSDMPLIKEACILPSCMQSFTTGKHNGFMLTGVINTLLVSFFNKYLKDKSSEILENGYMEARYPCLTIEKFLKR